MTFFNKKEEVLDVQLTQLGKYLLSKGKFKPSYYVFSDDEILYDPEYVGSKKGTARETSNRIQKETQRFRALYEHDGVESRVMALNGHTVEKTRGHGWQARVRGRTEEMPFDQAYGLDTVVEEKMGADDRNLVRNFIGNSTVGERTSPSWNVASLRDGSIENINISSSSPNVGIKRPIINFEVDYVIDASEINPSDSTPSREQYDNLIGLEGEVDFLDNFRATISDGEIVFSIIEENVDYDLENFEFQFYEIENKEINTKAKNAETEQLKKLYFSDDSEEAKKDKYIEHYFDITVDQDLAETYDTNIHGVNRFKVRDRIQAVLSNISSVRDKFDLGLEGLENYKEDCD